MAEESSWTFVGGGPVVTIYGDVTWPSDWGYADKRAWIDRAKRLHEDLRPGVPIDPDSEIAVLEYDLAPVGPRPNLLEYMRELSPNAGWPPPEAPDE